MRFPSREPALPSPAHAMIVEIILSSIVTAGLGGIGLMEILARRRPDTKPDITDRLWPVALVLLFCLLLSWVAIWLPYLLAGGGRS